MQPVSVIKASRVTFNGTISLRLLRRPEGLPMKFPWLGVGVLLIGITLVVFVGEEKKNRPHVDRGWQRTEGQAPATKTLEKRPPSYVIHECVRETVIHPNDTPFPDDLYRRVVILACMNYQGYELKKDCEAKDVSECFVRKKAAK
jgi:hypothetical protein